MTTREGLEKFLKGDPGVGAIAGNRIWPDRAPQTGGTLQPTLILQQTGANVPKTNDGPEDYIRLHFTLDCWATTRDDANGLAQAVKDAVGGSYGEPDVPGRAALDGFRGRMGGPSGVQVHGCFVDEARESYVPPVDGSDQGYYSTGLELTVWASLN